MVQKLIKMELIRNLTSIIPLLIIGLFVLDSCVEKESVPDTSSLSVILNLTRCENSFNNSDSVQLAKNISAFYDGAPLFSHRYFNDILPLKRANNREERKQLVYEYFMDEDIQSLTDSVTKYYPDNRFIEEELIPLFQNWKYYFPQKGVPRLFTFQSAFNYGVVMVEDEVLGIGLDFFLGRGFEGYHPGLFPDFMQRTMDRNFIAPRVAQSMIQNYMEGLTKFRLLDHMIEGGKLLYVMDKLLPNAPDSILFHYTKEKIDWMNSNEAQTWAMLLKEKLLYSENMNDWNKLVKPSPSGPSLMPIESPGEAGNWMGWQIVKSYMARNKDISLLGLLENSNSQEILDKSRYKPR